MYAGDEAGQEQDPEGGGVALCVLGGARSSHVCVWKRGRLMAVCACVEEGAIDG